MSKLTTTWCQRWGSSLASAINGGQWSQTRKANVAKWSITDLRCQLCFKEVGTLQHRFYCEATAAHRSSNTTPASAQLARGKLCDDRFILLRNRGVVALKIPAQKVRNHGTFKWIVDPFANPDKSELYSATWYIDGSLSYGQ